MSDRPRSSPGFTGYAGYALGAVFFFYAWILRVSPSVMVDPLMRDFAVSGAVLGNLSAFYFYAYASLQMPVGMALDRWGPRKVMSLGVLLAGVGCLIFASAPGVEVAYVGRTFIGAGAAFGLLGGMVLAGAWFSPRRFAMLSGLLMTTGLMGGIVGQAPMALAKVASGGELSRMSLAIQVIASDGSAIPTMIFDEVDSGVGGGIAEMVGRRLRELAASRQVLCVTHLPQVASQATHHLRINKVTDGKSTRTGVSVLQHDERVGELARMLGGVEITRRTREHAAEMLGKGGKRKRASSK